MINKLMHVKKNFIINNSDSGKQIEEGRCFLKGGTLTVLWSSIVNYAVVDCMNKQDRMQ